MEFHFAFLILLRQRIVAGVVGFTAAIGVHPIVGYNNPVHLAPACLGAICYFVGLHLTRPRRNRGNIRFANERR